MEERLLGLCVNVASSAICLVTTKDTRITKFGEKVSETFVSFVPSRLCRNAPISHICHPEHSEGYRILATYEEQISRLRLEMTITTQSVRGEDIFIVNP